MGKVALANRDTIENEVIKAAQIAPITPSEPGYSEIRFDKERGCFYRIPIIAWRIVRVTDDKEIHFPVTESSTGELSIVEEPDGVITVVGLVRDWGLGSDNLISPGKRWESYDDFVSDLDVIESFKTYSPQFPTSVMKNGCGPYMGQALDGFVLMATGHTYGRIEIEGKEYIFVGVCSRSRHGLKLSGLKLVDESDVILGCPSEYDNDAWDI